MSSRSAWLRLSAPARPRRPAVVAGAGGTAHSPAELVLAAEQHLRGGPARHRRHRHRPDSVRTAVIPIRTAPSAARPPAHDVSTARRATFSGSARASALAPAVRPFAHSSHFGPSPSLVLPGAVAPRRLCAQEQWGKSATEHAGATRPLAVGSTCHWSNFLPPTITCPRLPATGAAGRPSAWGRSSWPPRPGQRPPVPGWTQRRSPPQSRLPTATLDRPCLGRGDIRPPACH